jgi:hypothetical protein
MKNLNAELLKKNPKIDRAVVSAMNSLQKNLPEPQKPKEGADYKLSPPLSGQSLATVRRG